MKILCRTMLLTFAVLVLWNLSLLVQASPKVQVDVHVTGYVSDDGNVSLTWHRIYTNNGTENEKIYDQFGTSDAGRVARYEVVSNPSGLTLADESSTMGVVVQGEIPPGTSGITVREQYGGPFNVTGYGWIYQTHRFGFQLFGIYGDDFALGDLEVDLAVSRNSIHRSGFIYLWKPSGEERINSTSPDKRIPSLNWSVEPGVDTRHAFLTLKVWVPYYNGS